MKKRMRVVVAHRSSGRAGAVAEAPGLGALREPWSLGGVRIPNRVVQAPLAGIGNWAFRLQSHRHGAGLVVSEMVASMGIHHGNRKTTGMLRIDPGEGVTAIQLFGSDPAVMAEAARADARAGAAAVDINMGCPVPKICKTGAGAALLADPAHAASIVRAMADAVSIPVMVKMRRGVTPADARPVDLGRRFEQAGAAALTVHPRAAAEEYAGTSDHRITGDVAAAVAIPVVASGDILTASQAADVLDAAGCAAVMIGRAALGDPWLLGAMAGGLPPRPGLDGVVAEITRFAGDVRVALGDTTACHYMRKFYPWYLAGEDVPQAEVAALLTDPTLDDALARLGRLAGQG